PRQRQHLPPRHFLVDYRRRLPAQRFQPRLGEEPVLQLLALVTGRIPGGSGADDQVAAFFHPPLQVRRRRDSDLPSPFGGGGGGGAGAAVLGTPGSSRRAPRPPWPSGAPLPASPAPRPTAGRSPPRSPGRSARARSRCPCPA